MKCTISKCRWGACLSPGSSWEPVIATENTVGTQPTDAQQHEYAISRLKELRNTAVSFMGRNTPIGSAYVYDIVNEALTIIGEKQHTS